ncbi:polyprenyl synthetase family protein [Infirmifilum lucidum]|uniref:Polyprenyl synthetase family protein n=1 Tax=Infirmifilum lucidum TaxID=2776706 RepID=A0A7L9FEL4_9CREN|nr:polyprenyl synthetase family protein [Infirmifilum lucidum]QOJ78061.1 polyprenyl synthetase family protein [Infirmifilum lucidum]
MSNPVDLLVEYGKRVDPVMEKYLLRNTHPDFADAVLYPIRMGGKRVRPALTILSALAVGGKAEDAYPAAAAVELAHNYSLILDDIIDHSELRRGLPTVWKKYGLSTAILVAVHYRESISEALNDTRNPRVFHEEMARTIKLLTDGERLDILFEQSGREDEPYVVDRRYRRVTLSEYLEMVEKKTGVLIETACVFGGLSVEGVEVKTLDALREYGRNVGVAFQVSDDIIDIFGREEKTGKKVGGDIKEHKLGNIVILLALEELGDESILRRILTKSDVLWEEVSLAINEIKKTGAYNKAEEVRRKYTRNALAALERLPDTPYRRMLEDLAIFIEKREF